MNFQGLLKVEDSDFYLDVAFRRAKQKSDIERDKSGFKKIKARLTKSRIIELVKLEVIKDSLKNSLQKILKSFPSIDTLDPFYKNLVKVSIDYVALKQALGSLNWADKKILFFYTKYMKDIRKCQDLNSINKYRREFYGRISSVLKQIKTELKYLEECRRIMKNFPTIKTGIKTIAIVGFPNVGKTTLMYKLTGSKPEISSYAFTTKGINVGYVKGKEKIQFIDTPGTLNRFDKMNSIEKQAYLVIKYLAERLIYVFDLTESSFPLKDQIELFNKLKKENKDIIIYLSKTDLLDKKIVEKFKKKHRCVIDVAELKKFK